MSKYILFALLIVFAACQTGDTDTTSSLPNIIFILADDPGETNYLYLEDPEKVEELTGLLDMYR